MTAIVRVAQTKKGQEWVYTAGDRLVSRVQFRGEAFAVDQLDRVTGWRELGTFSTAKAAKREAKWYAERAA